MEERSTNEKVGIYIIVALVVILVIVLILYKLNIFGKKPDEANIVMDDSVMFKYSRKKWSIVNKNLYEDYNWNQYKVYSNNDYIGKKSVVYMMDKWYVFESNRDPVVVPSDKLYLGGKINIKLSNFKKQQFDSNDTKYIHSVLDHYKIDRTDQNKYTYGYKVLFDFDSDGKSETLYVISNLFSESGVDSSYSFVFIKDNEQTKMVYNKISKPENNLTDCYSYLYGIVMTEGTDNYQFMTKCSHYSVGNNDEYGLYQYENNSVQLLLYSK